MNKQFIMLRVVTGFEIQLYLNRENVEKQHVFAAHINLKYIYSDQNKFAHHNFACGESNAGTPLNCDMHGLMNGRTLLV